MVNYSANTIHFPICAVDNIFNWLIVTLAAIIRIILIVMDVKTAVVYVIFICQG